MREIVLPARGPGRGPDPPRGFSQGLPAAGARHQHRGGRLLRGPGRGGIVRRARLAYGGVAAQTAAGAPGRGRAGRGERSRRRGGPVPRSWRRNSSRSTTCGPARRTAGAWSSPCGRSSLAGETSLAMDARPDFSAAAIPGGAPTPPGSCGTRARWATSPGPRATWTTPPGGGPCSRSGRCAPRTPARRITRRDASRARAASGDRRGPAGGGYPGPEQRRRLPPRRNADRGRTRCCYHGHIVALVVGESIAACRAAAALVEVDYEVLAPIVSIPEAIRRSSYHTEPHVLAPRRLRRGPGRGAAADRRGVRIRRPGAFLPRDPGRLGRARRRRRCLRLLVDPAPVRDPDDRRRGARPAAQPRGGAGARGWAEDSAARRRRATPWPPWSRWPP